MKTRAENFDKLLATVLLLAAAGVVPLAAAPTAQPAKSEMPRSVFIYPSKPEEGRDPFFPDSTRPYIQNPDKKPDIIAVSLTDLAFRGILQGKDGIFAIINNHPFGPGDEGDVITKDGRRLTIHCVSINPKANTVTIEANGASVVLTFSDHP